MKLKVIDVHINHESDRDFETAVDISFTTIEESAVLFETPGGVRFSVASRSTSTSYSYMEPDWDHLEKTGVVSYETHSDESRHDSSEWVNWSDLFIAGKHAPISLEEFKEAFKPNHKRPWDVFNDESLPAALRERVAQHMDGGDGRPSKAEMHQSEGYGLMESACVNSGMGQAQASALLNLRVSAGQTIEVELSPELERSIAQAEKLHAETSASNWEVNSENRARAACARVQNMIEEMAEKAQRDMRRSFSSLMLANR